MCGIAGALDLRGSMSADALRDLAAGMARVVAHRGPDDQGTWADGAAGIAFGHQRLSIVDLTSAGHQPMTSRDGRWTVTFNGEIYNFDELRRALEQRGGRQFRGRSDTEVLVEGLAAWGLDDTLQRVNAMFSFGAWDAERQELHLVRDRLGEKPLYWSCADSVLVFASELQALRYHRRFDDEVDRDALAAYFALSYVPGPTTIYRSGRKLAPGSVLSISTKLPEPRIRSFWSLADVSAEPVDVVSDASAIDELDELLLDAVALRRHADVPIGAFLSGGLDSTAVVALLGRSSSRPIKTFTIAFRNRSMDESAAARAVAKHLGTDHHEIVLPANAALDAARRVGSVYDEPFGDPSSIPSLAVADGARRHVKVAVTGDGGDEVFAGYNRHVLGEAFWRRAKHMPVRARAAAALALGVLPHRWVATLGRPAERIVRNPADKVERLRSILPASDADDLLVRLTSTWPMDTPLARDGHTRPAPLAPSRGGSFAERLAFHDTVTTLPDEMLVKVDRASMHVGLEVRVPLLDHRIVEWVWRRPFDLRMREGSGKWVLRQVLARHVPPALTDRPKMGFDPPLAEWLRGPLREWASDLLSTARLAGDGFVHPEPIERAWREHLAGRRNRDYQLWAVLAFQAWLDAHHH